MKLHPFFVHFPIAFVSVVPLFEIIETFFKKFRYVSFSLLVLSLLFSLASVQTGNMDFQKLNVKKTDIIENHKTSANYAVFSIAVLTFIKAYIEFLSRRKKVSKVLFLVYYFLLILAIVFIWRTAFYGIIFSHGG